jgi:glycosyltransferase involved in cell wall biosynthesis
VTRVRSKSELELKKLAVIVPFYNTKESWILETFQSVVSAACKAIDVNFHVIIVDDCSYFAPPKFHTNHLPNLTVEVIRHDRNLGLSEARNTGIDRAENDSWILFLDSDDFLCAVPALEEGCIYVGSSVFFADEKKPKNNFRQKEVRPISIELLSDLLFLRNPYPVSAYFVMKKDLGTLRFKSTLRACEDWDFWIKLTKRCADLGVKLSTCREVVTSIRKHASSMSADQERVFLARSQMFSDFLSESPKLKGFKYKSAQINESLGRIVFFKSEIIPRLKLGINCLILLPISCYSMEIFFASIRLVLMGFMAAFSPRLARFYLVRRIKRRSA